MNDFYSIIIDRNSEKPMYKQLGDGLRKLIEEGVIPPDTRLPAIRKMAEKLKVNTVTVVTAYKYLEKTTDFSNNQEYITCQEAEKINLAQDIIQCGGNKTNITNYTINNHITKDLLNKTITKIFNRHITNYTNFYTSENNLCYYINNEYLCVSQKTNSSQSYAVKEFVKAYEYQDHLEIIEKYYYVNNNIHYQGFNTDKVGEATYISTFKKTNGSYYWNSTKLYNEN